MRRHRPNPVIIIAGLAVLAALYFLDMQGRVFFSGFKEVSLELIRDKIGLEGEMGGLEGGVFRGIILKDVKLYIPASSGAAGGPKAPRELFFSADTIELDYRLWDAAFGRYDTLDRITVVSPKVFFPDKDIKYLIPKVFEQAWEETVISLRDGSFYNAQNMPVVSGISGNFKVDKSGIESRSISASILGQAFSGRGRIGFPVERSSVKLEGTIKGRDYALRVQIDGAFDKIFIRGSLDALDRTNLNFAGNIAASEGAVAFNNFRFGPTFMLNGLLQTADKGFSFDLFPEDDKGNATAMGEVSKLGISGDLSKLPNFSLEISANHLKVFGFDVMSNYMINGKLSYGAGNRLESVSGDFSTSGSIISYDPIREVKGAYEFKDGKLKLTGVNYGDVLIANASVSLEGKRDIDIRLKFKGAQLGGLTDLVTEKGMLSGTVMGDIYIRGELGKEMNIDGQIEFLNGNISIIRYNTAKINVRGRGSRLEFIDSKVYTDSETLVLEGAIDMADLGTPRVFNNIEIKSGQNEVVWAGVNVTKTLAGDEYVTGTNLNEQFRVNFKTYEAQNADQQRIGRDEMDLEYNLGAPANLKVKMKEEDEFIGVEHKVRF
ncbi:MAG: hypothetical protein WC324_02025 [Candidatus Omnitrophota bacterium]|jgi:hypothetical protein